MRGALAWGVCATALALGCSPRPSESRQMRLAIEPYLDEHARFDRWARRLSLGDSAFRNRAALEEAAFAPLRERGRVTAAWIVRVGPDPRELRHPTDAPSLPETGWVRVRTERYGELTAQRAAVLESDAGPLTLVRRSAPAPGDATLHVVLGFATGASAPE